MAFGAQPGEEQAGDRPCHAQGRRLLRVPGRQQVLHRQKGLHRQIRIELRLKPSTTVNKNDKISIFGTGVF